jgi:hypothetical protein
VVSRAGLDISAKRRFTSFIDRNPVNRSVVVRYVNRHCCISSEGMNCATSEDPLLHNDKYT